MKCLLLARSVFRQFALLSFGGLTLFASPLLFGQSVTYTGSSPALDFGTANVCPSGSTAPAPCNKTMPLTYKVTASGTLGTPVVVTGGAPNLDFTLASNTCSGVVTEGATCTVNVTFAPRYAGSRNGAVEIMSTNGTILTKTLIYGLSVAPQIAFDPATETTLPAGYFESNLYDLAVDEAGFVYLVDANTVAIRKFPSDGATPSTIVASGFLPQSFVLDGANDIFFATGYSLGELPAGESKTKTVLSGQLYSYVTVTGAGDLFSLYLYFGSGSESDIPLWDLVERPAAGGSLITTPLMIPAEANPNSLTVDRLGNIIVLDTLTYGTGPTQLHEVPAGGGAQFDFPFDLTGPGQLAPPDAAGDLFFGTFPQVMQLPAGSSTPIAISAFPNAPYTGHQAQNVAVTSAGDVFSVLPNLDLAELHRSQPPQLTFPETNLDTASLALSAHIQNIGNAPLSLRTIMASGPFTVVPGPQPSQDCAAGSSLVPGAQCNLSITFNPESQSVLTGTVTVTDDSLNKTTAHVIQLSGTIGDPPQAKLSTTLLQYGYIAYPSGATLPLTITNIGGGTLTIATSINGPSFKVASSSCGAGITSGNSCTLQVQYAPVAIGYHGDILSIATNGSLNNGPTTLTVSLQGRAVGVGALETQTTLNFGQYNPDSGYPPIMSLSIYNESVPGLVTVKASINGPSFTIVGSTCNVGFSSGKTCTLQIQFNPLGEGYHGDTLTITPSSGSVVTTIKLEGIGQFGDG